MMNHIFFNNSFNKKINLLNFSSDLMRIFFKSIQEKSFRSLQMMNWIYKNFCTDFNKMNNFSISLRNKLKSISIINLPIIVKRYVSVDKTIKWLIQVSEGVVETIYIPEKNRATLCISSQLGCILNCNFCATGMSGFKRNLSVSEIIGQVWLAYKEINYNPDSTNHPITNIVIMGMGEPLLNLKNVVISLKIMSDNLGFNISKNKIVLSTSGIVPALNKLSNLIDVKLAISLHAPNDMLRNKLMPINKKYNIQSLLFSVLQFLKNSKLNKNGITIEYIMLKGINDNLLHAKELVRILKNIPSKINLIPYNSFTNNNLFCSNFNQIQKFYNFLVHNGFVVTIRKNRGQDIFAACGQLTGKKLTLNKL